ncbi:hypothetical protein D9M68_899030 [compost metagenome]
MRAALDSADEFGHALLEAGADAQALEGGIGLVDAGADGRRCIFGDRLDVLDHHALVDGHADDHLVQHTAGRYHAVDEFGVDALGVDEAALEVEHPVAALVAGAQHLAGMQQAAGNLFSWFVVAHLRFLAVTKACAIPGATGGALVVDRRP